MFGFRKLTPEQEKEHQRNKRIEELEKLIQKESEVRAASLERGRGYVQELDVLRKSLLS